MQLQTEQTEAQEREQLDLLVAVSGVDEDTARRVLRKHRGDADKAANALLNGDRGDEPMDTRMLNTPEPGFPESMRTNTPISRPSNPVGGGGSGQQQQQQQPIIDLTGDDEDEVLRQAMQMSMETVHHASTAPPKFEQSDRAPHPDWQLVRSDGQLPSVVAQDEKSLNEAIQASLQDFNDDDVEPEPTQAAVREGNRPIAILPKKASLTSVALIVQALYFVPQVRAAVSNLRLPELTGDVLTEKTDRRIWNLVELFTNMDLSQFTPLVDNDLLSGVEEDSTNDRMTSTNPRALDIAKDLSHLIEHYMQEQSHADDAFPELFSFTHGHVDVQDGVPKDLEAEPEAGTVVTININPEGPNELIACLSSMLTNYTPTTSMHDVIISPPDVFMFSLGRSLAKTGTGANEPFGYPKTIYLDRFLYENLVLANEKRNIEFEILEEIRGLGEAKATLTTNNGRDTIQDLRSTIYYYENVAESGGNLERKQMLARTLADLNDILTVVLGKVEDVDHRLRLLHDQLDTLWDCPELQQHRYDLRAVLVHSGLPGRNNLYSYVQDIEGVWWKTVGCTVTEVTEETVLTDPTGLHLNAGPFLLFYSRHLTQEELQEPLVWPNAFSEAMTVSNRNYMALLHPELEVFSRVTPEPGPGVLSPPSEGERRTTSRANSRMVVDSSPR